jgi:hypothetical protein
MQRMINTTFLCLALISSAGCKPNHRYVYEKFDVHTLGVKDVEMSCDISFRGSEQNVGRDEKTGMSLSYFRSPYIALISFRFPKEQTGVVVLQEILFFEDDAPVRRVDVSQTKEFDNKTEFRKGGVDQVREEDESRASFLVKQISIPHSKQRVLIQAVISTDKGDVQKTWEFELVPVIEEELRNDQRDSIMSV